MSKILIICLLVSNWWWFVFFTAYRKRTKHLVARTVAAELEQINFSTGERKTTGKLAPSNRKER